MAEAIHRQLATARGGRLAKESLAAAVVPTGISKSANNEKYYADTLRELIAIGALHDHEGHVMLPADYEDVRAPNVMRRLVRDRAMVAERDKDIWEKDDKGSLVLVGARDLVRAVAWFLSLDVLAGPYAFDKGSAPLAQLQEDHTGERLIYNETRWLPFVRWARYLGFMREVPLLLGSGPATTAVMPDPTDALADVLLRSLPSSDWIPLTSVMSELGTDLPVVDGGVYRRAIHDGGAPEATADISSSLSFALERLRARGEIELEVGAGDAEKLVFANNRGAFHALRLVEASA